VALGDWGKLNKKRKWGDHPCGRWSEKTPAGRRQRKLQRPRGTGKKGGGGEVDQALKKKEVLVENRGFFKRGGG